VRGGLFDIIIPESNWQKTFTEFPMNRENAFSGGCHTAEPASGHILRGTKDPHDQLQSNPENQTKTRSNHNSERRYDRLFLALDVYGAWPL
jgi:hypothetical protein